MKRNIRPLFVLLFFVVMRKKTAFSSSLPENWGIGLNAGGGELIGLYLKKDIGIFQINLHAGASMTFPYDELTTSSNGDTLYMRSIDQIFGINIRTYILKNVYASVGISANGRRVETNIERIWNGTDRDISAHEVIEELPTLIGYEFFRERRISFYGEGGYVFQMTEPGKEKYYRNNKYVGRYKEPEGSVTVGFGLTYNFIGE